MLPKIQTLSVNVVILYHLPFQMTDLAFFLAILLVAILAYGVASQALRFPNDTVEWKLLKNVVYLPYWQMYGELFLDEIEGIFSSIILWNNIRSLSSNIFTFSSGYNIS